MRLTLRTLLAYLDDTLDPSQAKEIGQKVAESPVAQELVERIKKVTRRRGLTTPPATGPDHVDANTIAEYLDNDLSSDKVTEVEELALKSDVVLAEIAACHQILTLVLGEPAHVPPPARERMYALVKGRESVPGRRASRVGPAGLRGDVESDADRRSARRSLTYRLVGAGILAVALGVAIWQALPRIPRSDNQPPAPESNTVANNAAAPKDSAPTGNETPKPADTVPADATPQEPARATAPAPPPAPNPGNPPVAPPKAPIDQPPDRSPSTDRREIGQVLGRDAVLLARDGDTWKRVASDDRVRTVMPLLSLPGYHSELKLDSGPRLALWGNLPDLLDWPILESAVTLYAPPAGFDLDFTLDRGRVYLTGGKSGGPAKVRVRFASEVWDLTLADEKSEVLLESVTSYTGEPFRRDGKSEPPLIQVSLGVVQGRASVQADLKKPIDLQAPPGPAGLTWDNKRGAVSAKPLEFDALPPYWGKTPFRPLPRERVQEIDAALRKLRDRAAEAGKPIELAIAEVAQDPSRAAKVLTTLSQGALGLLPPLLDALEDTGMPELRQAAVYALQHFIARRPENDQRVFEDLQSRKGYTEAQATTALRLLHGFTEAERADPTTYEFLINGLRNEQLGVRELAFWRLGQYDREGARLIRYNAADPDAQRDRAVVEWRRRIPEGKLPPAPLGPQGRGPAAASPRG